jgi:UPF0176 protein
MQYRITTLYDFTDVPDIKALQSQLISQCESLEVVGTLLLATEGINGTIAGSDASISELIDALTLHFPSLRHQDSFSIVQPFKRMKVKRRNEIVTMGVQGVSPDNGVGQYVPPLKWNALIQSDDVILIDTRNDYEFDIGTFEGAIDPQTDNFREFPAWIEKNLSPETHTKVAMFCTGGIRCEKATSYLMSKGFKEVFHLEGGILNYLKQVTPEQSKWQGECFVFDERMTLTHGLKTGELQLCSICTFSIPSGIDRCLRCFPQQS